MQWSATALGGAVSSVIIFLATRAEFSYIPTTWNNASHLTRRLLFLCVTLGLTAGPTFYVAFFDDPKSRNQVPLAIAIVQFVISCAATILFGIVPSGRMFGDRVGSKSRKYLASQKFTASYPELERNARIASVFLWVLIFSCKFVESYFFLTLSFQESDRVMAGTKSKDAGIGSLGTRCARVSRRSR